MSRPKDLLAAEERERLAHCVQEPIHIPGTVQPHGALLTVDPDTLEILQASDNTGRLLGAEPGDLLGCRLDLLPEDHVLAGLRAALSRAEAGAGNPLALTVGGQNFDVAIHRSDGLIVAEFEPSGMASDSELLPALHDALQRLSLTMTVGELRAAAARELARLTGFDRVMVYHFHHDGHGEVVAEECAPGMQPYLGLHYPASDIPAQARRLYLTQASRMILATDEPAARVLPTANPLTGAPLDLSRAQLRSVSPHHVQFMRNMGQAATLSLSLVHDGDLVGMITCAHRRPQSLPHLLRRGCEVLAQHVTLQLGAMVETQRLRHHLKSRQVRSRLVQEMIDAETVGAGLVAGEVTLLDLVAADGASVCLGQRVTSVGLTPTTSRMAAVVQQMYETPGAASPLTSEALSDDRPDLAELLPGVAGLVVVPLGRVGDYLAWFRQEVVQSVDWLGDQSSGNRATPLSPRNSFEVWAQEVRGRSLPWNQVEVEEATELRHDVDSVLLHRAEAQLAHLGMHDALTGLANRRLLTDRLRHALDRHARGVPVCLLFIDLDHFKVVNDSYGHDVGDALIVRAAGLITRACRASDTVARLGGDEFTVLCEDTTVAAAEVLAARIVEAFEERLDIDGHELRISASMGLTVARGHTRPADLLREADSAMYLAKERGRNQVSRFDAGLHDQALRRSDTEQALRLCLERDELVLEYQPIVDVDGGAVRGVEALLRWRRPGHGLVAPGGFLALAEDTGLIVPIGEWALGEALRQCAAWRRSGVVGEDLYVSVNLSPRQLTSDSLPDHVSRLIELHTMDFSNLILEITETTLMSERSEIAEALGALAELGVCLSIDDFGTGYSSLSYLRDLPVSQLKVDGSFVAGITASPRDAALVAAAVGLAHEFGMTCVAEGVETAAQLVHLRDVGCNLAQGYHLGRPTSAEEFAGRREG